MATNYCRVVTDERGKYFLSQGQKVMYRNNLVNDISDYQDGSLCKVYDLQGNYLVTGFLSTKSHNTVRVLTNDNSIEIDEDYFKKVLSDCYNYRKSVLSKEDLLCCRLVFGKADNLPGLTIDRYNDVLVTQISCSGIENNKDLIYRLMRKILEDDGQIINVIYQRNEISIREKEGLKCYKDYYLKEKDIEKTTIVENGLKISVDFVNGQKTGYFLDQKTNRMEIQKMAKGLRVLDCFSHTGGFALNSAKGLAKKVTAVDVSATALAKGKENAIANNLQDVIEFVQDDVFQYLKKVQKGQFDMIILDPPAFCKSRKAVDHAYNGYLEINTMGFKLLNKGGYLVSCSCSRYMEQDNYERMLNEAAENAGVKFEQIYFAKQCKDHPVDDSDNDTYYLKFYILKVI